MHGALICNKSLKSIFESKEIGSQPEQSSFSQAGGRSAKGKCG